MNSKIQESKQTPNRTKYNESYTQAHHTQISGNKRWTIKNLKSSQ